MPTIRDFQSWMRRVNESLDDLIGSTVYEIEPFDYAMCFEDGDAPEVAARVAAVNAGYTWLAEDKIHA